VIRGGLTNGTPKRRFHTLSLPPFCGVAMPRPRWLGLALDREGHFTDTHPTLLARLAALVGTNEQAQDPLPALHGPSAAQAWLGPLAETLRSEFQLRWADSVATPWSEGHAQAQEQRLRLSTLSELVHRNSDEEIERLRLTVRLEPGLDVCEPLAAFNAKHADNPQGLFLEGSVRLNKGDAAGLALLDRSCLLDPETIKTGSLLAYDFLLGQRQKAAAEVYAERWRARDALENLRAEQLRNLQADDDFLAHGLPTDTFSAVQDLLAGKAAKDITEAHLARRLIPSDPSEVQWVLTVKLSWWAARIGRQDAVLKRLTAIEWPVPLLLVMLDGRFKPWLKKMQALSNSRLV
jgi:hypothetical protein